jgi:hypothetical protein
VADTNIAYIISAYKLPDQLVRLVRKLDSEDSSFFIHVDKKTDSSTFRCVTAALSGSSNVHFLPRHRCDYGGFGHVKATTKGIVELFRRDQSFDYVVLLTGQDYPIKSNRQISDFFVRHRGRSFLEYFPLPYAQWENGGMDRVDLRHSRVLGRRLVVRRSRRGTFAKRFPSLKLFGGSAYWCLSHECAEYVYQFLRKQPAYGRFFQYVNVPDEIFFQTIVMNSPFRERVVNDDLRFVDWRNPAVAGGPAVLGAEDFSKLAASPELFARKFDITKDAEILELIDARTSDG